MNEGWEEGREKEGRWEEGRERRGREEDNGKEEKMHGRCRD